MPAHLPYTFFSELVPTWHMGQQAGHPVRPPCSGGAKLSGPSVPQARVEDMGLFFEIRGKYRWAQEYLVICSPQAMVPPSLRKQSERVSGTLTVQLLGEDGRGLRAHAWDQGRIQTPALDILKPQALTSRSGEEEVTISMAAGRVAAKVQ